MNLYGFQFLVRKNPLVALEFLLNANFLRPLPSNNHRVPILSLVLFILHGIIYYFVVRERVS